MGVSCQSHQGREQKPRCRTVGVGALLHWGEGVLRRAKQTWAAGAGVQDKTPVAAFLLYALGDGPSEGGQLSYSHS